MWPRLNPSLGDMMNSDLTNQLRAAQVSAPRQVAEYAVRRAAEDNAQSVDAPEAPRPAPAPEGQGRNVDKSV
jgi:hypothetical protein